MPIGIRCAPQHLRHGTQQVARRLHIQLVGFGLVGVRKAETHLHDKQVFVVVTQNGVAAAGIVEIFALEGGRNPWHVDIVEVDEVELVLSAA